MERRGARAPGDAVSRPAGPRPRFAAKVDPARFLQVDLLKPVARASLGEGVVSELRRGVALLHRIAPASNPNRSSVSAKRSRGATATARSR